MSEHGLCWCGLGEEMHDGREMDALGNMHVFGQPVYKPGTRVITFEDDEPGTESESVNAPVVPTPPSPSLIAPDAELLKDVKRFLDTKIIQPAQGGSKKFALGVVNEASRLSRTLDQRVDRLLFPKR